MRKGDLAPLYATSGGKALLAFMDKEQQEHYLQTVKFDAITPNTIRTVRELRRQVKVVRETGVAFVAEEFTPGIVGLAVPVLSGNSTALGALSVAVPAARFDDVARERVVKALNDALVRIDRALAPRA